MLTNNAKCIFCYNVTCFRTNNCCSKRSHLPQCFIKAPHFLLERVQRSTCFPISLSAYTLQLPPSCVLHPDLKKFCSNKPKRALRALLTRTRTLSSNRGLLRIDVSAPCTRESKALDVSMTKYARSSRKVQENKVTLCDVGSSCNAQRNKKVTVLRSSNLSSEIHKWRPLSSCHALPADRRNKALVCWLTTLKASSAIMSHALELINAARIGVICQSTSTKLPTSCLHGYSVSLPRNTPDCPGCDDSYALERI